MIPKVQRAVRKALHQHPDGLTAYELAKLIPVHRSNIRRALRAMPDTYVDRWARGARNSYEKVWCIVYVPPDCPHPLEVKFHSGPPKTRWVSAGAHA